MRGGEAMNCKGVSELLTAYLDGKVTPEEREQIDAHLSICPRCREELKSLTAIQENLRQALKVKAGDVAPPTQAWAVIRRRLEGKQYGLTPWGTARSQLRAATDFVIKGLVSRQPVWKVAIIGRVDRILVALYRISESPDRQPLYPLAEQIERCLWKFSQ